METNSVYGALTSVERVSKTTLQKQYALFRNNETFINLTNSVSQILVVLNKERQIVFANNEFCKTFSIDGCEYLGLRVGEVLNCIHASQTKGGCGTTEFCTQCGALNAMLESHRGIQSVKECKILKSNREALDLKVQATPYTANGEFFTVFVVSDISNQKRRQILERVFFHDVLNSAGGISGLSAVLNEIKDPNEVSEIAEMIHHSSDHLINEIAAQRQLIAAEDDDLEMDLKEVETLPLMQEVADLYSRHEITTGKFISIDKEAENFVIHTDRTLLMRVLGNMLKNALEASSPSSTVTLLAVKDGDTVLFSVHNQSYIEREVQLQLFKRSYTTKGVGRGLGTYSMKLFGEKYLKGKVRFESDPVRGTTFFIKLPLAIQ